MSWIAANRQFDSEHLYIQWLNRRRAWPMRIDYRLMPYFWIISGIISFLLVVSTDYGPSEFLMIITGGGSFIIAFILPLVNTILDFIYYVPRSVHDDESSSMMQFIFMAPVESMSILRDLRKWAVLMNLKHLAPSALLVIVGFMVITHESHISSQNFSEELSVIIPLIILIFLFWAFLLGTGLAAAGLPWKATSTGAIILCWVVPCLVGVFWGGSKIAEWSQNLLFRSMNLSSGVYNFAEQWFIGHFIILMLIPTAMAHMIAPRLMERRRCDNY
jgi:hypothetical protein